MMKSLFAISLGMLVPTEAIDFQVRVTKVFQDHRGGEAGNEEYSMVTQARVTGYSGPSTCITCNSGGDCTSNGVWADSGRTYTSGNRLNIAFTAWEDDVGGRCSHDSEWWDSDDAKVTGNCYFTMTNYVSTAGWHTAHCIHTDAWVQVQFRWWPDPTPAPPTPAPHYCTVSNHNCDTQHGECFMRDGVHNEYHCACDRNYVCVSGCDWPFNGHKCHRNCQGYNCPNAEWVRPQDIACSGTTSGSCNDATCCPSTDAPETPSPTTDAPPTPTPHDCNSGSHTCDANSDCFAGSSGSVSDYICVCRPDYICETPVLSGGCTSRCLHSCAGFSCPSGVQWSEPSLVKCSGTSAASCDEATCCPETPVPHQCDSGAHTCDVNSVCHPGNGGADDYVCICKDLFVCEHATIGQGCNGRCLRSCTGYTCSSGVYWPEPAHAKCSGPDVSSCDDTACCPCYNGVRMTAPGASDAVDIQPVAIANGELDLTHTRFINFPTVLQSMTAYPFPRPAATGTKVHLKCCEGEKCAFAFALYRCTDCTGPLPYGMTQQLLLDNWNSASCSPKFDVEFGTSLFYKSVEGPYEHTFELQHDELFVTLMKSGSLPVPICDKPHGPFSGGSCGTKCPVI
eukprot:TRINITY_DN1869_c0_g1_i11.p1 TRINITY_DN1869_c0_g1~~TRINITY_DN1869_c0_g1_i11.p1  ORF type:complete len:622 (+),score=118.02 TRINITY_DN1869_c0_g1_i11:81-1946(+)